MPIRAILDGEVDVQVPMPEPEWQSLRLRVKNAPLSLKLPCCQARAIPRKRLGTQHFVHFRHGECDWEPETQEHLAAKFEIIEGIKRAGWSAIPEHTGNGWRADVVATDGSAFKAFEVQWSNQSFERTLERQERYNASAVPAMWFFQTLPRNPKGGIDFSTTPRQMLNELIARDFCSDALPFFLLKKRGNKFIVRVNNRVFCLRHIAELVTKGMLVWKPAVSVRKMTVHFQSVMSYCWSCMERFRLVTVHSARYVGKCGLHFDEFSESDFVVPEGHFNLVQRFLETEAGKPLDCRLVMRTKGGERMGAYLCPNCGRASAKITPFPLFEGEYPVSVDVNERVYSRGHWCFGERRGFCSDATDSPSPKSWLE